jgi:hypothetical protein
MLCRSVLFVTNASDMLSRFEKHAAPTLLVHRFPKCVSLVVIRRPTPNFGGSLGWKPICAISYVYVVLVLTCLRACSRFGLDYRIGSAMWSWRRAACRAPLQGLCFAAVVPCYTLRPRPAFCMDTESPDEMLVKRKWTYQWLHQMFTLEQLPPTPSPWIMFEGRCSNWLESAEPPWRRGPTESSSSSLISREELDGERASLASSPWNAPKYIDATFETMLRRRGRSKGIPDPFQDSIRDMCHHAYGAWEESLFDYIWPNVVKAVNEEVKTRAGTKEGPCSLCGGEWSATGMNMRLNLFECAALRIYDKCPFGAILLTSCCFAMIPQDSFSICDLQ